MTNRVAGRYRLQHRLGRGSSGEVWSATDEVLGRPVAVKLLRTTGEPDDALEARFTLEARAAARLSHPNVVAVFDVGAAEVPFLVMELVPGRDLAHELAEHGPLEAERAVRLVGQAARGLAAAHAQGVLHRDIKPGNLLLGDGDVVKVADFGIARVVDDASHALTSTGQVVGTSYYLAPERARGRPATPASDVYSLGCVLHQLLTAAPPFVADTPAGIAYQHVDVPALPVGQVRPELSGSALEAFVLRMMAKAPAERPTAEQVAAWAEQPGRAAKSAPAVGPSPAVVLTAALPAWRPPLGGRGRRRVLVGAGSVTVVVAAALLAGATDSVGGAGAVERPPARSSSTAPSDGAAAPTTSPAIATTPDATMQPVVVSTAKARSSQPTTRRPASEAAGSDDGADEADEPGAQRADKGEKDAGKRGGKRRDH